MREHVHACIKGILTQSIHNLPIQNSGRQQRHVELIYIHIVVVFLLCQHLPQIVVKSQAQWVSIFYSRSLVRSAHVNLVPKEKQQTWHTNTQRLTVYLIRRDRSGRGCTQQRFHNLEPRLIFCCMMQRHHAILQEEAQRYVSTPH